MNMTESLLAQLEREIPATRRALERVPEGRNDWKPHPKSMSLGTLATLVAVMPGWVDMIVNRDELDISSGGPPNASSQKELVQMLERSTEEARKALLSTNEEHLLKPWRLKYRDQLLSKTSRYEMILDGTFSHWAHHRGQLTVYLRLNDIPVPVIYGATADERG